MIPTQFIGLVIGLASAIFYGSGDFAGGLASRRLNPYQVLTVASIVGFFVMASLALVSGEGLPSTRSMFYAGLGGSFGTIGLALLFAGLARGNSAIVSPVSAVVGAALPVLFTGLTLGLPVVSQMTGIAIAIPGIWLVTYSSSGSRRDAKSGFLLGISAGVGFGLFFILISYVEADQHYSALAFLKLVALALALLVLLFNRKKLPALRQHPPSIGLAALSGILDPLANALYLSATRLVRLDIAVVLVSLYPAFTVLLSRWFLREHITRLQWLGIGLCLVAIVLISI